MYYIIYLIGTVLFILKGIGFSNVSGFRDSISLILVLFPCFLALLSTKSLKSFGACFLFPFGKRNYSLLQCKKCLESIKMVLLTSVIASMICLMISIINIFHSYSFDSPNALEIFGLNISVAILPLFYVLIIVILLIPLQFMLKQHMINLLPADSGKKPALEEGN